MASGSSGFSGKSALPNQQVLGPIERFCLKKRNRVVPEEQNPRLLTSGFHMHTYAEIQTQEVGMGEKQKEL